jgi:hypothetical protein
MECGFEAAIQAVFSLARDAELRQSMKIGCHGETVCSSPRRCAAALVRQSFVQPL